MFGGRLAITGPGGRLPDLERALIAATTFAVAIGEQLGDAVGPDAARIVRRAANTHVESLMRDVRDEDARKLVFDMVDHLVRWLKTEPHKRIPLKPPGVPGDPHRKTPDYGRRRP